MPEERCFVCASNEGVFLDIFAAGKNYREIIESCLSLKITKKTISSTKICHKCVYELEQCSKFVARYKKTQRTEKGKLCKKPGCCSLCTELGKTGYIFDLLNKNPLDNSKMKLHDIFKVDLVKQDPRNLLICLNCRYNLDVLFDLKCVFKYTSRHLENILNDNMTSSQIPKMNTYVVRRNTTRTHMSPISESKYSSDSDASTIKIDSELYMPALSSRKSSPQERKCDKCNIRIVDGMDMYRFHHSGNTVCKECWITMDPCEKAKNKIRKLNNKTTKTKLCSVFLKDILSKSLETKNKDSEIEKSVKNDIIVLSSDDSNDENDQKTLSMRLLRGKRKCVIENKSVKKVKTVTKPQRKKITRSSSVQTINIINKNDTRMTLSENAEKSESEDKAHSRRAKITAKSLASPSKSVDEKLSKKSRSRQILPKKRTRNTSVSSNSSNGNIKPMKTPRLTVSLLTDDSTEQKMETDTDDNTLYTCKICDSIFENKFAGLTHELSHAKKLEVVLKKVIMPETVKVNTIIEREASTEFDSPVVSRDEALDTDDVTNASTLQELSDLPEDDCVNNEQKHNTDINMSSTDDENKGRKINDETNKNKKQKTIDEISTRRSIQDDNVIGEGINDESNDVVNETAEKNNITEEKINDEKPLDKKDKNIHEITADNNVAEQPIETTKPNTPADIDITESDKSESSEEIEENEVEKQTVDKIDENPENKIENEENDNLENENTNKNESCSERINGLMNENEMETVSQSEIITNDSENLEDTKNKESNEDKVKDLEDSEDENNEEDGITSTSEKQKSKEEEVVEDNSEILIPNGDVDEKLSDTDTVINNDDKDELSAMEKCDEASGKLEKFLDVDTDESEKKINDPANGKIYEEESTIQADIVVENTEADNNIDFENNKSGSIEIGKNVLVTLEGNNIEEFMGIDEIAIDEARNTEQTPLLESDTTENIECKS
ncbi:hypothetical protein PV327_006994 [Microctonus hyperodae]|uniref:ZAD domain-containing protein n=1 Tax=Microctonus hyperodae TaxID=165561 RepID=A0AA39F5G2_MICHY|nr:hypothetical protein PV327_006994 [Microctonus hyperodae]